MEDVFAETGKLVSASFRSSKKVSTGLIFEMMTFSRIDLWQRVVISKRVDSPNATLCSNSGTFSNEEVTGSKSNSKSRLSSAMKKRHFSAQSIAQVL